MFIRHKIHEMYDIKCNLLYMHNARQNTEKSRL